MFENVSERFRRIPKAWLYAGAGVLVLLVVLWAGRNALLYRAYPFRYRDQIVTYARQNGLDPLFVASIIRNESKFNPQAVSHKGAIGLMQIMPDTGRWVADQMGFSGYNPEMLRDPATNIMIGSWYLAELKREFGGKVVLVVAAYNCGRGRVREWAEKEGLDPGPDPAAELTVWPGKNINEDYPLSKITIAETRKYVRSVLSTLRRYRQLYGDSTTTGQEPGH